MPRIEILPSPTAESPVFVDISQDSDAVWQISGDQGTLRLAVHWESAKGGWARDLDSGHIHPFYVLHQENQLQLWLNGQIYTMSLPQKGRRGHGSVPAGLAGDIKAPMPGSILKILVEAGALVEANAPLVIMESMKMEMTLTALGPGVIRAVSCVVGQLVEMNTVLIQMEAASDASITS